MIISGHTVHILGQDIDTDQIIPARFLKQTSFEKLGDQLFYDQRFTEDGKYKTHPLNGKKPIIIVCDENFGCGSSREHAPQAIKRFGIEAIVAPSYGPIFRNNCHQLGIPCLEVEKNDLNNIKSLLEYNGCDFEINLQRLTLSSKEKSFDCSLKLPKSLQLQIIEGTYDPLEQLLTQMDKIKVMHTSNELP